MLDFTIEHAYNYGKEAHAYLWNIDGNHFTQ